MAIVYRSAEWDTPWWVGPNRGAGRFNRAGSDPTQYLSEHPLAVFAERLRSLGRAVVADLQTIRWRCWAMEVRIGDLTVIDFDAAPAYGIRPEELVGDDWVPCQELADRRRAAGDRGLIIPSAALPGTRNVVLFDLRRREPFPAAGRGSGGGLPDSPHRRTVGRSERGRAARAMDRRTSPRAHRLAARPRPSIRGP